MHITANKHRSAATVAAAIADRLRERGHDAIALDATDAGRLDAECAIVIGSPISMDRWLRPARKLIDQLASEPRGRPVFAFTVGPVGDPRQAADVQPEPEVEQFIGERALSSRTFSGRLDWEELNDWADEIAERVDCLSPALV